MVSSEKAFLPAAMSAQNLVPAQVEEIVDLGLTINPKNLMLSRLPRRSGLAPDMLLVAPGRRSVVASGY